MRRDVFNGSMEGSQPGERPVIVPSTEGIACDLSERQRIADPFSSPRGSEELTRREDPTIGADEMVVAPSDDPLARFEPGLEKAIPFSPEPSPRR